MAGSNRAVTWLGKVIRGLEALNPVARGLSASGMVILFVWLCYIFADVLLRYVFDRPMAASIDISQVVLVCLVFLPIAYVQLSKSHLRVEIVIDRLPPRARIIADTATYIVCIAVVAVLIWQGIANTLSFKHIGTSSLAGEIPLFPVAAIIPVGCALFLVVLLRDVLVKILEAVRLHFRGHQWFLMFAIPVLIIVLFALWMQPELSGMSRGMVGILGIVVVFVVIFLGMPVALALAMVGIAFVGHLCGPEPGLRIAGPVLYYQVASYTWTVIPLFILMGYFIFASGLGTDAYDTAYKWLGHFRGGLAIATVGGSTGLAAVVGDPVASGITMGTVAIPEMRKYKYNDGLSTGVVVAGATLGPMIPPSIGLIIYGILAEVSIGKLFIAGIIPGLLLALSFVAVILISCLRNPMLGPAGERSSWNDRLRSLTSGAPIVVLFLIVIGGIYLGVFTAVEGGGIGAFMAFIIALAMRRMTWQRFKAALSDASKFIAMLLLVIGCGMLVGNLLAMSNLTVMMVGFIEGLGVSPLIVVLLILFIYLVLGLVMDAPVVLILTVPFLAPVAEALGLDLVWFGILLVLMTNLGIVTPPYGMAVFMLRKVVCPDVSVGTMFRGVIPFCLSSLAVCLLIAFFPALATWLPNLMR